MTEGTQEPAAAAAAPPAVAAGNAEAPRPGRVRRVFNWFWRGRELKQLKQQRVGSARAGQLALRGRLLFELGERARRPAEALPYPGDAAAAELFRQSAYWAVRAIAVAADAEGQSTNEPWATLPAPLLEKIAGSSERVPEVTRLVEGGSFIDPWELSEGQRALRASELAGIAKVLLDEVAWQSRARDALWIQRLLRIGAVIVLTVVVVSSVRWVMDRAEQGRDLAVGKPWRASSLMGGVGCTSPLQECGESTDFFFHTTDENGPWLEVDLGKPTRFEALRVDNRRDCCFDRAVPLIVEASNDQQHFRELARRTNSFNSWLATFTPTEARYVRLRVPRQSLLHLARVRVLR